MDVVLSLDGSEAECWQAKYEHARAAIGLGDLDEALKWSSDAWEAAPHDFTDAILMRANALMLAKPRGRCRAAPFGQQPAREQVGGNKQRRCIQAGRCLVPTASHRWLTLIPRQLLTPLVPVRLHGLGRRGLVGGLFDLQSLQGAGGVPAPTPGSGWEACTE